MTTMNHYDREFFQATGDGSLRSARVVAPLVVDLVAPRSVVDFGCGVGAWLRAFDELGVSDYLGLDGEYVLARELYVPTNSIRVARLEEPPLLGRRFDLAVCLEVGEHLPDSAAMPLVNSLTQAAPVVLFSAAVPGQGGTNHVNERWPGYWREIFSRFGYHRMDPIRHRVWRNPNVEWWYRQNIYLFASGDEIAKRPHFQREVVLARECPFELFHEDVVGKFNSVTGSLGLLRRAMGNKMTRILGWSNASPKQSGNTKRNARS